MAIEFKKTNFTRNLAKRHKLVQHLEKAIREDRPFSFDYVPKESDDAWHPSGHCTPSVTDLYNNAIETIDLYKRVARGEVKIVHGPGDMNKTFAVGHFWHQYLQHVVVDRLGFATLESVEVEGTRGWGHTSVGTVRTLPSGRVTPWMPYHWATGSGDIAPCVIPSEGEFVVDFKTMSSQQYRQNDIPDWAAAKYECQINIYMDFFDLERGIIVAINKDSPHDMKEWTFERNQPLIDAIYDKWEFVSECLDANEAPTALDDENFILETTGPLE